MIKNNSIKIGIFTDFKIIRFFRKMEVLPIIPWLFIAVIVVNFNGCCIYSFTGASVPEHLKTIAIPIADDRSGGAEPGLREKITQLLTQKFIDDNTLQVSDKSTANAILECTIVSLTDAPAIVSAGEQIATRRITISVQVVNKDLVKRKTLFEKTFSNYGDYPSGGSIDSRRTAIEEAIEKITQDILLDTVSGW
jgi:Lipopolysaccharide-assembly